MMDTRKRATSRDWMRDWRRDSERRETTGNGYYMVVSLIILANGFINLS